MPIEHPIEPLQAGPDLRLEPVEPRHAPAIFELVDGDRDRLGARLPWVSSTRTVEDTLLFVEDSRSRSMRNESGDWAILAGIDGVPTVVGVIGTHSVAIGHRRAAIGYWIAGRYEGLGFISRSVFSLMSQLFLAGFHRVEIRAAGDNQRSRSVAERLGFRLEGTCRAAEWIDGRPIDHAVYARLRDD